MRLASFAFKICTNIFLARARIPPSPDPGEKTLKKRSSRVGDEHFVRGHCGKIGGLAAICLGKSSEIKFADKRLFEKMEWGGGDGVEWGSESFSKAFLNLNKRILWWGTCAPARCLTLPRGNFSNAINFSTQQGRGSQRSENVGVARTCHRLGKSFWRHRRRRLSCSVFFAPKLAQRTN